ncbi:MAG: sodium:solute symporter, partial [bacterium]
MNLHTIDWIVVGLYLAFLGFITGGFLKRPRKDIADYLVAGRRLTLPSLIATTVSSWYGGILGVGEYAYKYGISMWLVFGIPYYLSAAIFALWIADKANQSRLLTIPDQLRLIYGETVASLGAIQVFIKNVPAAYFLMLGTLAHMVLGIPLLWGVVLGALLSTAYVWVGGFRGDVRTDWLQFFLMYSVFSLMVVLLVHNYGGWEWIKKHIPPEHLVWHGGRSTTYILSWYLIALGALVEPTFYQRAYAAKSPKLARKGFLWCIPFWAWFDFMTTTTGLYARSILGPTLQGPDAFPRLGDHLLPYGVKGLFLVGLIATIQSTADSNTLVAASAQG